MNSSKFRSNVLLVIGGFCVLFLTVAVLYWAQADRSYERPVQDDADIFVVVEYNESSGVEQHGGNMQMMDMSEAGQSMREKYADKIKKVNNGGRFLKVLRKVREKPHLHPSEDNPLYVSLGESSAKIDKMIEFGNDFIDANALQHDSDIPASYAVLDQYLPIIGLNGVLESLAVYQLVGVGFNTYSLHKLGEYAESRMGSASYTQLVEVVTYDLLHHAPLHGAMWSAIRSKFGNQDPFSIVPSELQAYTDEHLCFYEDYPDMEGNWISCVHGIGHAIGQLFGADHPEAASMVCYRSDNLQWAYSCGSGIFMNEMQPGEHAHMDESASDAYELTRSEWYPCDISEMAASCYRFKNILLWKNYYYEQKAGTQLDLCALHEDKYHQMGCSWAYGYIGRAMFMEGADTFEEQIDMLCNRFLPSNPAYSGDKEYRLDLYMSCLDGAWRAMKEELRKQDESFCRRFQNFGQGQVETLCTAIYSDIGDVGHYFWNENLLEKYHSTALFQRTALDNVLDFASIRPPISQMNAPADDD